MNKKNATILFYGLIWYAIIRFLKDYFLGLLYLMISGFNENGLEIIGLLTQSAVLIISAILFAWFIKRKLSSHDKGEGQSVWNILGIKPIGRGTVLKSVLLGAVCFFTFNILKNSIVLVFASFGRDVSIGYVDAPPDFPSFLFLLLMFCLWMPLGEELIYRGMLFHMPVERENVVLLTITNLLVFAGAHEYGDQAIQAFFLGLVLCLSAYRTKSTSVGIIIHMVFNLFGMIITYYFPLSLFTIFGVNGNGTPNEMRLAAARMLFVVIALLILLVVLISKMKLPFKVAYEVKEQDNGSRKMSALAIIALIVVVAFSVWRLVVVVRNTGIS